MVFVRHGSDRGFVLKGHPQQSPPPKKHGSTRRIVLSVHSTSRRPSLRSDLVLFSAGSSLGFIHSRRAYETSVERVRSSRSPRTRVEGVSIPRRSMYCIFTSLGCGAAYLAVPLVVSGMALFFFRTHIWPPRDW